MLLIIQSIVIFIVMINVFIQISIEFCSNTYGQYWVSNGTVTTKSINYRYKPARTQLRISTESQYWQIDSQYCRSVLGRSLVFNWDMVNVPSNEIRIAVVAHDHIFMCPRHICRGSAEEV